VEKCKFCYQDAQNERKSNKLTTENRYPDTGKCKKNKNGCPDAGQMV